MLRHQLKLAALVAVLCAYSLAAHATSCTTQSEMTPAQRNNYEQASRALAREIAAGNSAAVRAATVSSVASHFDEIASTISRTSSLIQKATLTIDNLYNLNATDLKASDDRAQFFCGLPGSSLLVTLTIPKLPPGNFVVAVLDATGAEQPQRLAMILQNDPSGSAQWKLAGLFVRPLTIAGRDGVWYWRKARKFAEAKQNLDAFFYYQTAQFLSDPVDFLSSPNLEKLQKEMQDVRPSDLPGANPLVVSASGLNLEVTGLRTDTFQGNLDLVVDYKAQGVSGPVATREQILELMKAILNRYPQLRGAFHGLWVYAYNSGGQPFAIEQTMNQIQ